MNDEQLRMTIASMPGEKVTEDYMRSRIQSTDCIKVGATGTFCNIVLDNGFQVQGWSACVAPENYNREVGERLAQQDAFRKLWPLFGFLLAESRFRRAGA